MSFHETYKIICFTFVYDGEAKNYVRFLATSCGHIIHFWPKMAEEVIKTVVKNFTVLIILLCQVLDGNSFHSQGIPMRQALLFKFCK